MTELSDQVRMLRDGSGLVHLDREVVLATGDAVVDYLQGQLSQDVAGMDVGQARWSFVLQPQGKVDAWFRVTRLAETAFVLDIDAGWADPLIARLDRFKLRTPATFERSDWTVTALRGAETLPPPGGTDPLQEGVAVPVDWPGDTGWDLIGPGVTNGPPQCSIEAMEVLRIEAGRPRMGHELDDSTIPAEAGVVPISVSFTKGCYTGQELVARIDSRGSQTPRRLIGVHLAGDGAPQAGTPLILDDAEVGVVTSSTAVSSVGHPVALAYLKRGVEVPVDLQVADARATAVALPLADSPRA
jgi:tRNA-modifying protein YgfZ